MLQLMNGLLIHEVNFSYRIVQMSLQMPKMVILVVWWTSTQRRLSCLLLSLHAFWLCFTNLCPTGSLSFWWFSSASAVWRYELFLLHHICYSFVGCTYMLLHPITC